jgi:hypothetical protein
VAAASELTIAIVVPLACVMIAQTEPVLRLLFLVKPAPEGLVAILPLMLLGGLAQVFVTLPHLFQVAAGRVATVAWINTGFIVPYGLGMLAAAYEYGVVGAAAAFAAFNGLRLLCHWIVLLTGPARVIWLRMIGMTLAAVAAGIGLAAVPAWAGLSNDAAMIAAVITVPVLTMLMLSAMPKSRARLFDFYRSAATRYRR